MSLSRVTVQLRHSLVFSESDGRPETQSVSYKRQLAWAHYLASKKEYIVGKEGRKIASRCNIRRSARVDVRGSGFEGGKWKEDMYQHLGDQQTEDLLTIVRYVLTSAAS